MFKSLKMTVNLTVSTNSHYDRGALRYFACMTPPKKCKKKGFPPNQALHTCDAFRGTKSKVLKTISYLFRVTIFNPRPILHPFGTIWGIKHLNMNLEHFCTSLSALFDMYSLKMSKVTDSTRSS